MYCKSSRCLPGYDHDALIHYPKSANKAYNATPAGYQNAMRKKTEIEVLETGHSTLDD